MNITFPDGKLEKSINWFDVDVSIKNLFFRESMFTSIESGSFDLWQFRKLETFSIIDVPLTTLKAGTFYGLENLKMINLDGLNLVEIDSDILVPVMNLKTFSLSACGPNVVKLDSFFGSTEMIYLESVVVKKCNLAHTITETTFTGLRNVKSLRLDSNHIAEIGAKSFDVPLKTLEKLDLVRNDLKSLPNDIFNTSNPNTISIQLHDNPWHCDCNLEHLRKFMQNALNVKIDLIRCKTPLHVSFDNYPDLCDKNEDASEDKTNAIDGLTNVPEIQSSTECESSKLLVIQNVLRLEALRGHILSIQMEDKKLFIDLHSFSNSQNLDILLFDHSLLNDNQGRVLKCSNNSKNGNGNSDLEAIPDHNPSLTSTLSQNIDPNPSSDTFSNSHYNRKAVIQSILTSNHLYKVCSITSKLHSNSPLNCFAFYVRFDEFDFDAWIPMEDKVKAIVFCVIFIVLAPIVGVGISVLLAKSFPKLIGRRKAECKNAVFLTLKNDPPIPPKRYLFSMKFHFISLNEHEHTILFMFSLFLILYQKIEMSEKQFRMDNVHFHLNLKLKLFVNIASIMIHRAI